jgi:hypothetical protein
MEQRNDTLVPDIGKDCLKQVTLDEGQRVQTYIADDRRLQMASTAKCVIAILHAPRCDEKCHNLSVYKAVPCLRLLDAGLSPRRPGLDPGSVYVGFVVDKVTMGQVLRRILRFSPNDFIPPVLHYTEKRKKKLNIFITGLHNKP